jgi:hypothetical protein
MPGTMTHFWIFRQALRGMKYEGFFADLQSSDWKLHNLLSPPRNQDESPKSATGFSLKAYEEGLLASYGYFGGTGPDLFLIPDDAGDAMSSKIDGIDYSDLMHYNKASSFIIFALKKIKSELKKSKSDSATAKLRRQLAYIIGHTSHIAADVICHPLVNTMAAAYPKNKERQFKNAEGSNAICIWKLHHKVEHYQDSWIREEKFGKEAQLNTGDWEALDFPRAAAAHLEDNKNNWFVVDELEEFYQYRDDTVYGVTLEKEGGKLNYFTDTWVTSNSSYRNYCVNIIPSTKRMQGELDTIVKPALFQSYLDRAVSLCTLMMLEIKEYLERDEKTNPYSNKDATDAIGMYAEKRDTFKLLRKNWNLDCGIGFTFEHLPDLATFKAATAKLHLPVRMHMVSKPA